MNDKNNDDIVDSKIGQKLDSLQNQLSQFSNNRMVDDGNVNFTDLWRKIWLNKVLVLIVTFIFTIGAITTVILIPDQYKSEVLLAPVEDSEGGISGMLSKVGGLASLAGIKIGKNKLTKPTLALEILKSRDFIKNFINRHNLLITLMAAEGWNIDTKQLIIDQDVYSLQTNQWVRDVSPPKKVIPSDREAHERFLDIIKISKDKNSGLITISVVFYSPAIAKQWLDWLITDLNQYMKAQDKKDANKSIQYLQAELELTTLAKMHTVFYQLIEEQTQIIMLANVRDEYVFKTIDPAVVADEKYSPRRSLIVVLMTLLGAIFGVIGVLMRERQSS